MKMATKNLWLLILLMIVQISMKRGVFLVALIFALLSGSVYAKSENSNSGNPGGNSGQSNSSQSNDKASVGRVEEVKENKITIEEKKSNKKVEADIDSKTEIIHQNKGKGNTPNSIRKDDKVAVVGAESGSLNKGPQLGKAVKIFVKEASLSGQSKRRAIQGVVLSIDGATINIAHQTHRDRTNTVFTDASTLFKIKGEENGSLSDVQAGNRIVAMGDATASGILAKRIHVIPGKAAGIFRRLPVSTGSATESATPSATPTATSSATPSATPTATSGASLVLTESSLQTLFSNFLKLLGF